jgi:L-lactate dehydrogenase complex protein LldG
MRDTILVNIRRSLKIPALGHSPAHGPAAQSAAAFTPLLPKVGTTFEERTAAFAMAAAELKADFKRLKDISELPAALRALSQAEGWKRIATHLGVLTAAAISGLDLPTLATNQPYSVIELEQCDAGITECDALVAQTGSVLLTSLSAGGRAISVLPPHHVVLARESQLLADLPAAFALLSQKYGSNYPSFISFTTGPSRTGDIERILVLGDHGPKKLTIFLIP